MVKEDALTDIKKSLKTDKLLFGKRRCLKQMKLGKLQKIFLACDCPEDVIEDIEHHSGIIEMEVVGLDIPKEELGILCKRQHDIAVLGVMK